MPHDPWFMWLSMEIVSSRDSCFKTQINYGFLILVFLTIARIVKSSRKPILLTQKLSRIFIKTVHGCCLNGAMNALLNCCKKLLLAPKAYLFERFDIAWSKSNQSAKGEKFLLLYKFSGSKKFLNRLIMASEFSMSCDRQRKFKFEIIKSFDRIFILYFLRSFLTITVNQLHFKPFESFP